MRNALNPSCRCAQAVLRTCDWFEGRSVSAHWQTYVRLNAATAACLISKNMSRRNQRALIANDNENDLAPVNPGEFGTIPRLGAMIGVALIVVTYGSSSIARSSDQNRSKVNVVAMGIAITGIASTYNPFRLDYWSGGRETASGEPYDPTAWTAAIQMNLRERFGGVGFGRTYQPTYALVSTANKQAIVKINDVGPLRPGRVIDLNEQTMQYFDPDLQLGLIRITVTPLPGDGWSAGPVVCREPLCNGVSG
jgi:rare lipoprotein A